MVNLVKVIESTMETDLKQMKFLKRLLKTNPSDINKLRQSTLNPDMMIAPIHAAVLAENVEILQYILAMKDVDGNKPAFATRINEEVGIIWIAIILKNPKNPDILNLLLEHIRHPWIEVVEYSDLDIALPCCLIQVVEKDRLDLLKVLLGNADLREGEFKSFDRH